MKTPKLRREIIGFTLLALGIFLLLSLISYHITDPKFFGSVSSPGGVKNIMGIVGAKCADLFLQCLGYGSYLIPVLLFYLSFLFFLEKKKELARLLAFCLFAICLSVLLSLAFRSSMGKLAENVGFMAGGFMGDYLSHIVVQYFSLAGAYLVVGTAALLSLMIVTRLSPISIGLRLFYLLRKPFLTKKKIKREIKRFNGSEEIPVINSPLQLEEDVPQRSSEIYDTRVKYALPPISLLHSKPQGRLKIDKEGLLMNARLLENKLKELGVEGRVIEISPGPVITRYEFALAPGIKVSRITNLSDDLAMALSAVSIRILAPIPGKPAVGIEIPNNIRETVFLKDLLSEKSFRDSPSKLFLALGKDISGRPCFTDLTKMPHLLIAGATGTGKSVAVNSMICSILYKATPDEVRFIMIDPKMLELLPYDGIAHLLLPVVTDPKKASLALKWAVSEMERRYQLLSQSGVRNIEDYNTKVQTEKLPYIVVIIDELADLMMVAAKEVEESIARLAQMARASGIHLIVATQRPSVDVITGLIKANFPARISFKVSSKVDSRTILDSAGAEQLLSSGDMLFLPPATSKPARVHGAYISDAEIQRIVDYIKKQRQPQYDESIIEQKSEISTMDNGDFDEKYDEAVAFVVETGQASISLIQRRFRIGYNRAARIIEKMEKEGIVGPADGVKPREVLRRI